MKHHVEVAFKPQRLVQREIHALVDGLLGISEGDRGFRSQVFRELGNFRSNVLVRHDAVDPGGWQGVPASLLIVPLDTHMFRIARGLGLTQRGQADLKCALEITAGFRALRPDDPVRYDFSLTRLGLNPACREQGLACLTGPAT